MERTRPIELEAILRGNAFPKCIQNFLASYDELIPLNQSLTPKNRACEATISKISADFEDISMCFTPHESQDAFETILPLVILVSGPLTYCLDFAGYNGCLRERHVLLGIKTTVDISSLAISNGHNAHLSMVLSSLIPVLIKLADYDSEPVRFCAINGIYAMVSIQDVAFLNS